MEQPTVSSTQSEETDCISERDIVAMVAMIDYLIAQIGPVNRVAMNGLVVARESLAGAVAQRTAHVH